MTKLLDTKEAAIVLGVSSRTVRRLVQEGKLRVVPVRGAVRIHPDDIDDYIAAAREAVTR